MEKLLENLNKEQAEAVQTTKGPLLILAGAGSGKSLTIIGKIVYLVKECNVNPNDILCISFTNDARWKRKLIYPSINKIS